MKLAIIVVIVAALNTMASAGLVAPAGGAVVEDNKKKNRRYLNSLAGVSAIADHHLDTLAIPNGRVGSKVKVGDNKEEAEDTKKNLRHIKAPPADRLLVPPMKVGDLAACGPKCDQNGCGGHECLACIDGICGDPGSGCVFHTTPNRGSGRCNNLCLSKNARYPGNKGKNNLIKGLDCTCNPVVGVSCSMLGNICSKINDTLMDILLP